MKTRKNITKKQLMKIIDEIGLDTYSFTPEFIDIIDKNAIGYYDEDGNTDYISFLNDVYKYGCVSGMIGEFVYYKDTHSFYCKYADSIECFIGDIEEQIGTKIELKRPIYNSSVWFAFEEFCYKILSYIEDKDN